MIIIMSNKMNNVTTELNVLKGVFSVCSCHTHNEIVSGMLI